MMESWESKPEHKSIQLWGCQTPTDWAPPPASILRGEKKGPSEVTPGSPEPVEEALEEGPAEEASEWRRAPARCVCCRGPEV
ncbi:unnamed protein product [Gadus morhua 'NCC']